MQSTASAERQRYAIRAAIRKLKDEISIEEYLDAHGVEVRHNRARCLVHDGDNPQSFSIDPERQLWHCFSCRDGGDLLDLCEMVEKHADTWTAVVSLAQQFNVELPQRPQRWHQRQTEKGRIREAAATAIARRYQRRLVKLYAPLALIGGETPEEELATLEELGEALWSYCMDLAKRRVADAA